MMPCCLLFGCIFSVIISESLAVSGASANNPSQFIFTPSVSSLSFPLSSNVVGSLPSQVAVKISKTLSSSSESSTSNLATGPSAPESPFTNPASQYNNTNPETGSLASQSATTSLATGPSASQFATTNSAAGTSAPKSATGSSEAQSAMSNSATGTSASQLTSNGLATEPSAFQTSVAPSKYVQYLTPVSADPIVHRFASSIAQSLRSLTTLKNYANFDLEYSHDIFYNYGNQILAWAGIPDPYLAERVSDAVKSLGVLSSSTYFPAIAYSVAEFLFDKGVLTEDNVPLLSQKFLQLVDKHAFINGANSAESIPIAVGDGIFDLLISLDLLKTSDDFRLLFNLVAQAFRAGLH